MKDDASIQGKLSCVMDVEAYLRRIGLEQAPRPDQEGLMSVQRAHRWAIPFDNFDIPLGRGIHLAPAAVFAKLVVRRSSAERRVVNEGGSTCRFGWVPLT